MRTYRNVRCTTQGHYSTPCERGCFLNFQVPTETNSPPWWAYISYPNVFIREILFTIHMGTLNLFWTFPIVLATSGMCLSTNQVQVTPQKKHGKILFPGRLLAQSSFLQASHHSSQPQDEHGIYSYRPSSLFIKPWVRLTRHKREKVHSSCFVNFPHSFAVTLPLLTLTEKDKKFSHGPCLKFDLI